MSAAWCVRTSGYRSSVFASETAVPYGSALGVETHSVLVVIVAVSASVYVVHSRRVVIEMSVRVDAAYGQEPSGGVPHDGAEEVVGRREQGVLPIVQDVAQVGIAVLQIHARHIVCGTYVHQVVQIDFVRIVVLRVVQVQFVCHLVGKESCSVACFLIRHGTHVCQGEKQGDDESGYLFHVLSF